MGSKEWCELASNVGVGEEEDLIKRDQYVQESRSERMWLKEGEKGVPCVQ